ncbi:MAG: PD-(D/E)XK nuclease family protein [Archaeoglobaceae archaeon]|nr:PD-(D/E)XK nuclease family protein [Archaeoglobaceae archaeon]MDW8127796.1 PD-(D/E)XK nuclease family protein [Archaeoglobaceae archaeon]
MSNEKWIESLRTQSRRLRTLKKSPLIDLVHDLPWVRIRDLADQFYCELKVDLELRFGKKYAPEIKKGSEVHKKVDSSLKRVNLRKLIEDIVSGKSLFAKFTVDFKFEDVPIVGELDQAFFREAKPLYLLELKSTNYNLDRIYTGEKIQALLYGLALERMGFDCSKLCLAVVKVRRDLAEEKYSKLASKVVQELDLVRSQESRGIGKKKLESEYIHFWEYNGLGELEGEIREKLNYWTKIRDPKPVQNPNKCKWCAYKSFCIK